LIEKGDPDAMKEADRPDAACGFAWRVAEAPLPALLGPGYRVEFFLSAIGNEWKLAHRVSPKR